METHSNSWTVVQFINDETVEAVPSSWIQGDLCHWPAFSQPKLIASIRHCDLLNTCWPTHKVKVFRNATFDDYIQARNKAKLAEETSDLNTADENGNGNKIQRKRKQIILSSSEDEPLDEISYLPTPPKIKNKGTNAKHQETANSENNVPLPEITMQNKEPPIRPAVNNSQTVSQDSHCIKCHENDKSLKILTQQNHILRGLVADTLMEVKDIKKILARDVPVGESSKNSFFKTPGVTFPVNTDEDFDQMETVLQNEEAFQNAVIELSKLGGSCEYDLVKRVLSQILTNDHTLKYSWLGRKGKKPFCNMNIAKLLLGVLDHSGIAKSRKDSENAIQTWLRRASDRKTRTLKKF